MKKILILNYEFPPLGGGAANATYYLLKELSNNKDISVDLVTSSANKYREEQFADNIRIFYLDIGKGGNLHYQSNKDLLKYSWKAYKFCKKLKKQYKYDLVHAFFGIPCGYIAMKLGLPYIVSLRGSDVPYYNKRFEKLDRLIFERLSKKIWHKALAVVANSQGLKELALKTSPQQKIDVIYNGVDTTGFFPENKTHENLVIVSTSRLIARKGIEYLLEAFIKFNRQYSDSRLILAGDGDKTEELKQKVSDAGITDNVELMGKVNHDKLAGIYRQSDIFVLPSLNEGMSNSLLESMACGLAIIATDTGGTKELVNGQNGIIIDKQNSEQIYDAFIKLQNNRELLNSMKAASRQKAEKMNWSSMAEKYLRFYENTSR